MEISFVAPSMVSEKEGVPPMFRGTLKVNVPSYSDRLRLQSQFANMPKEPEPGATDHEILLIRAAQMVVVADLADRVKPMVSSVALETDGGKTVRTADELFGNPAFEPICTELTLAALRGFAGN